MTSKKRQEVSLNHFPEDFHSNFFHEVLIEKNDCIPNLRQRVYKKIKSSISDRIKEYSGVIPLTDSFKVEFEPLSYSDFEWAVVRDELLQLGFDVDCVIVDEKLTKIIVTVERDISLTKVYEHEEDEEEEENTDSGSDSD